MRYLSTFPSRLLWAAAAQKHARSSDSYVAHFQPQTDVEIDLSEEMVVAKWRQASLVVHQDRHVDHEMDCKDQELKEKWEASIQPRISHSRMNPYRTAALRCNSAAAIRRVCVTENEHPPPPPNPLFLIND
jgi:hypothetical protein